MRSHRSQPAWVRDAQTRRLRTPVWRRFRVLGAVLSTLVASAAIVAVLMPADAIGPGTGIIVYSDGATNEPWVRDWNGSAWSSPSLTVDVHEWRTTAGATARTRDEAIVVGLNVHDNIRGEMWDGSAWTEFPFGTLASVNQSYWWSQAVAYERLSDDAVMVWANGTSSTTPLSYRVWDGATWSAENTIPVPTSSAARQLQLAASPDSDEMVLLMSDDGSRDYAFVWDGSAWGAAHTLSSSGGGDDRTDIAVAYEQGSGDALVVYGRGSSSLLYQTWNGSTWTGETSFPIPSPATGNVRWTALASDPGSDRIALGVLTFDADVWLAVWDGTGFGSTAVATQSAAGTIFPAVDVAFESLSGEAIAVYGVGSADPRYRTWSGSSWSAEGSAFDVGDTPNTIVLDADPYSNQIMATVQDFDSDLSAALWSGSGWGAPVELEADTKEIKNQPWVYLWGRYDIPPSFEPSALYRDEFNAVSYAGSEGFADWSPQPWAEIGESNGPSSGSVRVGSSVPSSCLTGGRCLGINDQGSSVIGVRRTADLDGASQATLSFLYWLEDDGGSQATFSVQVSNGVSGPWTTLATYTVTGTDSSPTAQSFDISDFGSAATTVRFVSNGSGSSDEFYLDDVQIDVAFGLADRSDAEGDDVDFTVRAYDPGGDSLTFSATGLPPGIGIDTGSGRVSGTIPQTAAVGSPYVVTVSVTDPQGNTDTASYMWTVIEVNVAPELKDFGDQVSDEGDVVGFVWIAGDADGDTLTWSATGLPTGLSIDPASGLISGTIDYGASISSPFSVTIDVVDDGNPSLGDSIALQWVVNDVNRPPDVTPPVDRSDAEGDAASIIVSASDADGNGLGYQAFGLPSGVSIDPGTGVISGTIDYEAAPGSPYSVLIRVTDDGTPAAATDVSFLWTIADTNRPPVVTPQSDQTNAEGDSVTRVITGSDPDGDGLIWSATGLPAGLSIDPANGLISGTIAYTAEGIHPVFIRATDDGSPIEFHEVSFTWTVTNTNRAPIVTDPGAQASSENDSISLGVNGADPDGDAITWSATGLPGGLSIDPSTGVVSGVVDYAAASGSPYAVTVRATDDDPAPMFTEVSFTWAVSNTNRTPVVTDPGDRSNAEDDPVTFATAGNDPDGDGLTWSATGLPQGISIDPVTGVISGTVGFDSAASSPFAVTIRATDDGIPSLFDEVSFAWDVANTNRAPVVTDPADRSNAEDDPVNLPILGSDPDGNGLTWTASGLPDGLSIDPDTGAISGTLTYVSAGSYSVTVRATDDDLASLFTEVSFTWDVANVNRAPIVTNPGAQTSAEDDPIALPIVGSDPDGDGLTWTATNLPDGLSIDPVTGEISGALSFVSAGSYAVTVRATDDDLASLFTEVSFAWDVANTNRPPVVTNPGAQANAEIDVVSLAMTGSDPDGNGLTWTASGLPDGLSIDPVTGEISGALSFVSAGSYVVTVRGTDDDLASLFTEVSFAWDVANVNRAPVVTNPGDRSDAEGDGISITVSATDADGDGITWAAAGLPNGLSIDPATGVISGTIAYDAAGIHSVTVRAIDDDPDALFTDVSFTWDVANTNRAPVVINPGARSDAENDSVLFTVPGSDPDGDLVTWTATGLPDGVIIDSWSGEITGVLTYVSAGSYPITVRATDDGSPNLFTEVTFTWDVANTNRAPAVTNPGDQTSAEVAAIVIAIAGSDPDGDTLTWSATNLPDGLSIDPGTGEVAGTLSFDAAGMYSVTIRATDDDPETLFTEVAFTWTVSNTNRAPVIADPGPLFHDEGTFVSVTMSASDPDGDGFGFEADGLPPGLDIDAQTGEISGELGFDLADSYDFTLTVTDFGTPQLAGSQVFTWTIGEVNRAPSIGEIPDRSDEQFSAVTVSVGASDPDGNDLVFVAAGLPSGVTIDTISGLIAGSPTQAGSFSVTVTVEDLGTPPLSDETTFRWTIVSPPGYPTLEAIEPQTGLTGDVVSFAPVGDHPDGLAITWSASGLPDGLVIDPDTGAITGTLERDGRFDVVIEVTDERDQTVAASFTWTVDDPDLPPVTVADTIQAALDTLVGGSVAIDVMGNDSDPEGGSLSLVSAGPADVGTIRIVDGVVLFDPPNGWLGTVTFEYVVADPAGQRTAGTASVTIEEALSTRIAAAALQWDPAAPPAPDPSLLSLDPGAGTELLLGTVVQSLYVLRVPLALLGGAVFWSLLLGGILNLGFVLKGGVPRIVRRSSRNVAIVMAGHGERVEALDAPETGQAIWRFPATERGLEATGRRADRPDGTWAEVTTPNGHGWVPLVHLTEEIDRAWFADDPEPIAMVNELLTRMRARRDFGDLVSMHGLAVVHHGPMLRFSKSEVDGLMEDPTQYTWKGRNPAYPDLRGTFDNAVATGLLDAWDHPQRELVHDASTVPSTVVPVEFTNFHVISIGADVHGPERLEQSAWLVVIAYEGGRPRIAGLVKEG